MLLAWKERPIPFLFIGWGFLCGGLFLCFFGFEVSIFLSVCFGLTFKIMKNSVAPVMDLFV